MKVPDNRAARPPVPGRRLLGIAAGGLIAAAILVAGGLLAERFVLGGSTEATRARVQGELRAEFQQMALGLREAARTLGNPELVSSAASDEGAAQRLFAAADFVVQQRREADAALSVFSADGQPVAWAGRPSEIPAARLQGPEAWFFVQGALGPRLVYVMPLTGDSGVRAGTVAVERAVTALAEEPFTYSTRFVRVSLMLNGDGATGTAVNGDAFEVVSPAGALLLRASVSDADLARARLRWRIAIRSLAVTAVAITIVLLCGPMLEWKRRASSPWACGLSLLMTATAIVAARGAMQTASLADWSSARPFSAAAYASPALPPLLASPFDFLLTAMAVAALVAVAYAGVDAWRMAWRHRRRPVESRAAQARFTAAQLAAGALTTVALVTHYRFIADTVANASLDLLHFSLHPWDASRVALQIGLVLWHASLFGLIVLFLRAATIPWRVSRREARTTTGMVLLWASPTIVWLLIDRLRAEAQAPLLIALSAAVVLGTVAPRLRARYRRGSQAFRLMVLTLALVIPTLLFYPTLFRLAWDAKVQLVESRYAPQALNQRETIQQILGQSLQQIDAVPDLPALVMSTAGPADADALADRAFQVWRVTGLAAYPITSSVELYGPDGSLVSRYAFNLPDDLTALARSEESSCTWERFEEVSPFFAEERRVLHAGRAVCLDDGAGATRTVGSIVVHTILDYANLPFISSQTPYVELVRPVASSRVEGVVGGDVEYAVYGWSRTPLFTSDNRAWDLTDATFDRIAASREPFWAQLVRGTAVFDVYVMNDRFGIYALGFPVMSPLGHLMNLAELSVLAAGTFLLFVALNTMFGAFSRRGTSARALLREVRASFYRKLFLAFVAAATVPVVTLAVLTRNYVAAQMQDTVEQEAVRTATAARRVVEDLVAPRAAQQGATVDDNLMVWVSRLIDQDVNIFRGARLQATSERNLFASGLLPRRTPSPVYRGLLLRNEAATVHREQIGPLEYLVAGTPVRARQLDAMLTVPFTSRQREIEREVDLLNRQVLLGALLFILAGAGLGYSLAERIADPVNRLTRATRRIARGELDVRIAATSSDELRRLVQDFNSMAKELERQRRELERTHRLEAWAEMSRQVAHDIKNPLTPIQLNAEHLRRVHADRGEPLGPVLEECVGNILMQVTLLRQLASEFSNFASSPTARRSAVNCTELLRDIVDPYMTALSGRVAFTVNIPDDLPPVQVDRSLVARALTNIVENALHAMPGQGALMVSAAAERGRVRIRVTDTGPGMDPEALTRAFEPYFSTKATGTGLGLPIAKRNIELNDGEIGITTSPEGTTVEVTLPTGPPRQT